MTHTANVSTRRSSAFAYYISAGMGTVILAVVAAVLMGGLSGELPVDDPTASEVARWSIGNGALWASFAALAASVVCAWLSSRSLDFGRVKRTVLLSGLVVVASVVFGGIAWFAVLPPV